MALLVGTSSAAGTDVAPPPDLSQVEPQVRALIESAHEKLASDPESAEAWGYYGSVLIVHEFLSEAIMAYETAAHLDPSDFRWPYQVAARLSAEEPMASLEYFERALRARDDYAPLHVRYGGIQAQMGRTDAALASYRRAVELDRRNAFAHAGLGKCLLDVDNQEQAKRHLYRAIRLNPRCRPALSATADYWRRAGDLDEADVYAARAAGVADTPAPDPVLTAVERMGVSTTAVLSRADALVYAGRTAEARLEIRKLVQDNPASSQGRRALGRLFLDEGEYEQALEQLRAALEVAPEFATARLDLAYALTQMKRFDDARQEYETVLAANQASAEAHRGLAVCLAATGNVPDAVKRFRRAVELDPEDRQTRVGYGKALYYTGDDEAAIEVLVPEANAAGDKLDKLAVEAVGFAGLALGRSGRHEEAVALLARATKAMPTRADLRLGWAGALVGSGRDAEAVKVLQQGLDLNPRAGRIALQLTLLLSTSAQDAVRDGQRAVRLGEQWVRSTQGRRAAVLDALACAYAEVGRYPDAVRVAQRALAIASEGDRSELAASISQHLEHFRQGKPYHKPPSPET
jgi:tetratricopeptide (TPR) repeat protein